MLRQKAHKYVPYWPEGNNHRLFPDKQEGKVMIFHSVAEPEPVEPKVFWDLELEPKINFNKHFLQSVWRMLK